MTLTTISGISIAVSVLMTWFMMRVNIADAPNHRSSHEKPTPKAGGVAIVVAFLVFVSLAFISGILDFSSQLSMLIAASMGMAMMGLLDDAVGLTFPVRLLVQSILASLLLYNGFTLSQVTLPFIGTIELGFAGVGIAFLWILGFTNGFNFMDGLNGIASGSACVVSLLMLAFLPMDSSTAVIFIAMASSLLGFLPFNFITGRIFMGDTGSQFLGFLFAGLALMAPGSGVSVYIFPLMFFPFIFDVVFTMMRRLLRRRNIFSGHREHLYQLLSRSSAGHSKTSLVYFALILLQAPVVYQVYSLPESYLALYIIPSTMVMITFAAFVFHRAKKAGIAT